MMSEKFVNKLQLVLALITDAKKLCSQKYEAVCRFNYHK